MNPRHITDPVEMLIAEALTEMGVRFIHESEDKERTKGLDFLVPKWGAYIECKRLHSARSLEQLTRDDNIILIQGMTAARMFSAFAIGGVYA